ncbi:hypothetical protein FDO65_17680 [Nakamurella flava]|uniref:Polysaccharide biosynthesis protein n=1 Tax=Nakamurella flava TaxID=2576308 RepID=A0A4V6CRF9_9ACTN|nr:hypothetical protein [Nakamurella flava]TKV57355.1 hypothetical protein FDO65_17680 [Nakamurella flava]
MTSTRQTRRAGVRRQTLFYTVALGLGSLVTGVLFVFAARSMPPGTFGLVSTSIGIATVLAGVIDFGTNSLWVRELSDSHTSVGVVARQMRGKAVVAAATAGALAAVLGTWLTPACAVVGLYLLALVVAQMSVVPLRARVMPARVVSCTVADRSVAASTMLALSWFDVEPALRLPVALSLGSFAGAALAMWRLEGRSEFISCKSVAMPWGGAAFFGLSSLVLAVQNLDQAVVLKVAGASAAADVGAVSRWMSPIGLIGTALANTAGPLAARAPDVRSAWSTMKPTRPYVLLAICVGAVSSLLSPWLVPAVLGTAYAGSIPVFQILAISATITVLSQPVVTILQFRGYDRTVCWVVWSGVMLQFTVLFSVVSTMGAIGCAIASLTCQVFILAALVWATCIKVARESKTSVATAGR